jgi:hypothetical protein
MIEKAKEVRKALVGLVGVLAYALSLNLIPEPVSGWIATAIAVATVFGIHQVPNDEPGKHAADA